MAARQQPRWPPQFPRQQPHCRRSLRSAPLQIRASGLTHVQHSAGEGGLPPSGKSRSGEAGQGPPARAARGERGAAARTGSPRSRCKFPIFPGPVGLSHRLLGGRTRRPLSPAGAPGEGASGEGASARSPGPSPRAGRPLRAPARPRTCRSRRRPRAGTADPAAPAGAPRAPAYLVGDGLGLGRGGLRGGGRPAHHAGGGRRPSGTRASAAGGTVTSAQVSAQLKKADVTWPGGGDWGGAGAGRRPE